MAGSVNKVILVGHLGSDPEVRYLDGGAVVAKFNIATSEPYTNKSGERVEQTEWHRIELWDRLAQVAEKFLKKGNQVYVEGRIRTDNWTDKEGQQRSGVTIRANTLTLLGSANREGAGEGSGNTSFQNRPANPPSATPKQHDPIAPSMASSSDDDDLPF